ncbi:MAG TPA: ABC transporter permease, partial [Vicinamibacterales bacterium]|nr:ABC transporter permease [Vicinamibacterales bacterium]
GRTIRINGQSFEIVGVAAAPYRGLNGVLRGTRIWIPLAAEPALRSGTPAAAVSRDRRRLTAIGRLDPSRTVEQASSELASIGARLDQADPPKAMPGGIGPPSRAWRARPLSRAGETGSSDDQLTLMLVAFVGLVLVVACTNLANLVLARGASRQGELAVRMAMGASRGRLIWEQCVESLLLAGAGFVVAYGMFRALAAVMTKEYTFAVAPMRATLSIQPTLDTTALGVAIASMLLALLVFGLEPAVQLARAVDLRSALARGASGIRPRLGRQRMVIRWQVAVAAGFFIVATMFIRGTINLARHDPGVDVDRLAVAALDLQPRALDESRLRLTIDRVLEEARRDPAIASVSASTGLPFGVMPSMQVAIATTDDPTALDRSSVAALAATPSLFETLGVPILRGRAFNAGDGPAGPPVVVLSELAAKQLFGSTDAIGRSLQLRRAGRSQSVEVVGVARDTDVRFINAPRRPLIYLPLDQHFDAAMTIAARANGDAPRAATALRNAIARVDADLPVTLVGTGEDVMAGLFTMVRSLGLATLYLGGFTLLLAMVGLFGVQSHLVAHRTREIGVRMALGASVRQIKAMVLRDGYRPVVEGLILGLWGGMAARLIVRSYMQVEVNVFDPWMLLLTPIPLVVAAFCACYLPAARASAVEPTVALRAE